MQQGACEKLVCIGLRCTYEDLGRFLGNHILIHCNSRYDALDIKWEAEVVLLIIGVVSKVFRLLRCW